MTVAGTFKNLLAIRGNPGSFSFGPLLACMDQAASTQIQNILRIIPGTDDRKLRHELPPLDLLIPGAGTVRVSIDIRRNAQAGADLLVFATNTCSSAVRLSSLRRLSGVLPHALRIPLTAISGFAEILTDPTGEDHGGTLEILGQIFAQTQFLETRITKLETLLNLMHGGLCSHHESFRVIDTAQLCIAHALAIQRSSTVRIDLKTTPSDPWVSGCRQGLEACLDSLIENACIAVSSALQGHVGVSIDSSDHEIVIRISDNGRGIPQHTQSRITDAWEHSQGGIGLGMCIVVTFAEMHQGGISLRSSPGDTCFTLRLPWSAAPFHKA